MVTRVSATIAALVVALMSAAPAMGMVRPTVENLPDGAVRPIVASAELREPGAHNDLLEADLVVEMAWHEAPIVHYEYRWNGPSLGRSVRIPVDDPTVSYEDVRPDSTYALQVRAVDAEGWESHWHTAWKGTTPSPPNVIVAGDSVASGYSRQWFTGGSICRDDGYSYGSTVHAGVASSLPAAWQPTYINIAWPGAGVGSVLDGGSDSCSESHPSQVDLIEYRADPSTWNVVVMTVGINSTNWVDVITELTRDTLLSFTDSGDKRACQEAVTVDWDLDRKRDHIAGTTATIVDELASRTNARIYWTSYYQLAGTRFAPLWSPVGGECEDEMNLALDQLHDTLRAGLGDDVTWIDLSDVPVSTQKWAGWPHPNPEGHQAIGASITEYVVRGT